MDTRPGDSKPSKASAEGRVRVRRTNIRKVRKRKSHVPWISIILLTVLIATGLGLFIFAFVH